MNIKLKDGYRISSDAHQYILQKYEGVRERNGKTEELWKSLYFIPTIEMALNKYFDLKVRTSDVETWAALLDIVNDIRSEIKEINQILTFARNREGA